MARKIIEIDFVKELAEKYKCSICTGLLETPVLTECCGQHFYKECMEKWLAKNNSCPHCRAERPNKMVNKALRREIDELKVYCKYKKNGCKIIVQYSELNKHENDCPFEMVTCPNDECCKKLLKKDLEDHLSQECDYRIMSCQLCNKEGEYRHITESHIENDCPEVVISCGNKCGKNYKRKDKDRHKQVCPLEIVECPFSEAGCTDWIMVRKDLDEHLETSLQQHLSLTLSSHLELERAHKELQVKHFVLQGRYDMVLSSVADKLQSRRSHQEQLADIGECIQPFLHVLKPGPGTYSNTITLQFLHIRYRPLGNLPLAFAARQTWAIATPSFCIDGYPGCRIYIAYKPLTIVMELVQPGATFPPDEVMNRVRFRLDKTDISMRDDFISWKDHTQKFRLSEYQPKSLSLQVFFLISLAIRTVDVFMVDQ